MSVRSHDRSPENTSLTISLSKDLKSRIEAAAAEDKRKVSPWCVIQLENILDELESKESADRKGKKPHLTSLPKDQAREA